LYSLEWHLSQRLTKNELTVLLKDKPELIWIGKICKKTIRKTMKMKKRNLLIK